MHSPSKPSSPCRPCDPGGRVQATLASHWPLPGTNMWPKHGSLQDPPTTWKSRAMSAGLVGSMTTLEMRNRTPSGSGCWPVQLTETHFGLLLSKSSAPPTGSAASVTDGWFCWLCGCAAPVDSGGGGGNESSVCWDSTAAAEVVLDADVPPLLHAAAPARRTPHMAVMTRLSGRRRVMTITSR